jgi:hypothetical protein
MRFSVIFSPAVIVSEGVWLSESIIKMLGFEADAQFVMAALAFTMMAARRRSRIYTQKIYRIS